MQELTIDYSKIQEKAVETKSTWRPPRHVFFGKRDPETGAMEDEPSYVYQEFPRMLYLKRDNSIEASIVNSDEELSEKLAEGWVKNPAQFGFLTAPSFEQLNEMRKPKVEKAESKTLTLNKK
jgi:hypothetical protein